MIMELQGYLGAVGSERLGRREIVSGFACDI